MTVMLRSPTFHQPATPPTAVVLVHDAARSAWSTALENQEGKPFLHQGRYFTDKGEALADYYERAQAWARKTAALIRDNQDAEVGL